MVYNKVIGVGHSCLCREIIRTYNLSTSTYPLDWMEIKIKSFIKCVENQYSGILEDIEILPQRNDKYLKILDKKYNFTSIHDIKEDEDFNVAFKNFKIKILKRVEKWKNDIIQKDVCFIHLSVFSLNSSEDINRLYDVLKSYNNDISFHYLVRKDFNLDDKINKNIVINQINNVRWKDVPNDDSLKEYVNKYHYQSNS